MDRSVARGIPRGTEQTTLCANFGSLRPNVTVRCESRRIASRSTSQSNIEFFSSPASRSSPPSSVSISRWSFRPMQPSARQVGAYDLRRRPDHAFRYSTDGSRDVHQFVFCENHPWSWSAVVRDIGNRALRSQINDSLFHHRPANSQDSS